MTRDETMDLLTRFWNGEPLSDKDLERALVEVRKVQRNLDEAVYRLERENAELRARIGRLESALSWTLGGHCSDASKVLDERPRQSLASIKAEALREFADHLMECAGNARNDGFPRTAVSRELVSQEAMDRADRIEHEAGEAELAAGRR